MQRRYKLVAAALAVVALSACAPAPKTSPAPSSAAPTASASISEIKCTATPSPSPTPSHTTTYTELETRLAGQQAMPPYQSTKESLWKEGMLSEPAAELGSHWNLYLNRANFWLPLGTYRSLAGFELAKGMDDQNLCVICTLGTYAVAGSHSYYCKSIKPPVVGSIVVSRGYTADVKNSAEPSLATATMASVYFLQYLRDVAQQKHGTLLPGTPGGKEDYCVGGIGVRALYEIWPSDPRLTYVLGLLQKYLRSEYPITMQLALLKKGFDSGRLEECLKPA